MEIRPSRQFPSTVWALVEAAKECQGPDYFAAMNRFISGYWKPVFYFIRAKGYPVHRAEDLTQEFFLGFLERGWISLADPDRGRFRNFLLTILIRFLSDQGPKRLPRQKRFEEQLVSVSALMDEKDRAFEPAENETPEQVFMQHWARAVIARARRSLELWCENRSRPDWYRIFAAHFPSTCLDGESQQAIARRLHLSRDQVRYGLEQAKRQFVEFLRAEVGDHVGSEGDVEDELKELEILVS